MQFTQSNTTQSIIVPVTALALYAIASGYLMSLIPLILPYYQLSTGLASWLASAFYTGLLLGALIIEPLVIKLGHKKAFVACLCLLVSTVITLPMVPESIVWITARFVAGIAVAGIFVVVESWLLDGDAAKRSARLGFYMMSLYGGSAFGQLGIAWFGVTGILPFFTIFALLAFAICILVMVKAQQPDVQESTPLSISEVFKLNKPAIVGCIVSGLTLGAIYGLLPLALVQRNIDHQKISAFMALVILGGMLVQLAIPTLSVWLGRVLLMAGFCFIGASSVAVFALTKSEIIMASTLFVLGMAVFALYPVAIALGCQPLTNGQMISATQVMLFTYSLGSVFGPLIAARFIDNQNGLMSYLFFTLLITCLYMLVASVKRQKPAVAGE